MLVAVSGDIHHVISENIEDVKVGDEVLTRNQNDPSAPLEAQPVVQLYQHTVYSLEDVTIQGSDGSTETIRCTTQHPFYVEGIGWVGSGQLVAGEHLIQADGSQATVVSAVAESDAQGVTVYNFEVANDHTYFVDENGEAVWVHNSCQLKWNGQGGVEFRGHIVEVTEDLTHLSDERLLQMLEDGTSPRNIEGEVIHLHHVGQRADGMLWELSESSHLGTPELHPLGNKAGVGLTESERAAFDVWRNAYWQQRAAYELQLRGFIIRNAI